jgi:transcriptional/translational regulatory protein YebC/TACO1
MQRDGDIYLIVTNPTSFHELQGSLRERGIVISEANLVMNPKTTVHVEGRDAERLLALLEALEDQDDVQSVYSNLDIDETVLAELAGAGG